MQNYTVTLRTMGTAALCLLCLTAGCSRDEPAESETVAPVRTAPALRAPVQRIVGARAILHAVDQATVIPKISAPVSRLLVHRGDHVRKGQLLAVLESRDLAAAAVETKGQYDEAEANFRSITAASLPEEIAKAQAEVQAAKEALDAAQKLLESRKGLFQQGALPRRQVDEANVAYFQARSQHEIAARHLSALEQVGKETGIRQAQAQLDAARGRQEAAEAQLEYSRIYSPIDGVIADRPIYAGEMVGGGTPLLTVMDVSRIVARANVPAEQLAFVKAGNAAVIRAPESREELHGRVTVVSPALDPNSTTAEVWVEASNPGEQFRPGAAVEVEILAQTVGDAVVIPLAALLPAEEGASVVFVVGSDSLAHARKIETGIRGTDTVQILRGVEPGEQVVVVGGLGLEDGAKVRVEKPGETPAK